jgi:hypothetical protein
MDDFIVDDDDDDDHGPLKPRTKKRKSAGGRYGSDDEAIEVQEIPKWKRKARAKKKRSAKQMMKDLPALCASACLLRLVSADAPSSQG